MSRATTKTTPRSFRMPNSLVQGLTTTTPTGLNRLTSVQMVTLFGLVAHIPDKQPQQEVRLRVSDILEIIRVSKSVAHVVDRRWTTGDGQARHRRYNSSRYSPKLLTQVHQALSALHNQSVAIQYLDPKSGQKIQDRIVHILDSFGYLYEVNGEHLDVHDLPPHLDRVNVGTDDRPLWRVRRQSSAGVQFERPTAVTYRLNSELAQEIFGRKNTIGFTHFAHRVFDLFRDNMRTPAAIRLLVTTLRQTEAKFTRRLTKMLDDHGFDTTHPTRALRQLEETLARFRDCEVVTGYEIDRETDRLNVTVNRTWYQEAAA